MSNYLNAVCSICNTPYHICPDCSTTTSFTPWKKIVCSPNCYKIFVSLSGNTNGYADKAETKEKLSKCDLSNLDSFEPNVKSAIKDIMKEEKVQKSRRKKGIEISEPVETEVNEQLIDSEMAVENDNE